MTEKVVNASPLDGRRMISGRMVVGVFHVHNLYCFCFRGGTLWSNIQAHFTSGGSTCCPVIKEIIEVVEEVLALDSQTWKRNKSLSLPRVFLFFRRSEMVAQSLCRAGESSPRTREGLWGHGVD